MKNIILFILGIVILFCPVKSFSEDFLEQKSDHFIVQYYMKEDLDWARQVLLSAEEYYSKIAYQIGYARYKNFWTWDDRVRIIIYPDQKTFMIETQQPAWSRGSALRHKKLFEQKKIVSFKQNEEFLITILPHEIAHLIVHDFFGMNRDIPLWFDEGVAQLFEKGNEGKTEEMMRYFIRQQNYIPFSYLMVLDIREEMDISKVAVFYTQSLSIVRFLIKGYGASAFQQFCGYLRDGRSFEGALQGAYTNQIKNVEDLEKKWLIYMKS
jgi:hypothetical protein